MEPQPQRTDPPRRRRLQYSLRSLLVLTFAASLVMSWLAVRWERDRRVRRAVARLEELGAEIDTNLPHDPDPARAGYFLVIIDSKRWSGKPDDLRLLAHLPNLLLLNLADISLDDDACRLLGTLESLVSLDIGGPVTDRELDHLAGLKNLDTLALCGASVTDARVGRLFEQLPALRQVLWQRSGTEKHFAMVRTIRVQRLEFPDTPLIDFLDFCRDHFYRCEYRGGEIPYYGAVYSREDFFDIGIVLDSELAYLEETTVRGVFQGEHGYDAMRGFLSPLGLEVVVRESDLLITTAEKAAEMPRVRWACWWRRVGGRVVFEERVRIMAPDDATRSR
jgi:hypothetical protein